MSCVESEEWNVEGPQRSMGSLGRTGRGNGVSSSSSCSVASLRRRRPVDAANAEAGWPCWLHCCMSAAPGNGDRHKRNRLAILVGRIGGSRCGPSGAFPARGGPCRRPHPSERESVGAMPSSMDCQVTILCDVFLSQSGPFTKGRIVTSVCRQTDRQTVNV